MTLPRPKWTVRAAMIAVAFAAVLSGLASQAWWNLQLREQLEVERRRNDNLQIQMHSQADADRQVNFYLRDSLRTRP